jgi:hypothetical protein
MASPTQRSLAKWREAGAIAQVVERWNPHAKVRQDLFGCIDIIVIEGYMTIGVQATTTANSAARIDKALAEPRLRHWLAATGNRFVVEGWAKRGVRGARKLWVCRTTEITPMHGNNVRLTVNGNLEAVLPWTGKAAVALGLPEAKAVATTDRS